jgi:hypothetical protein
MERTMGKRSDFERVEKDFYRTIDMRAVNALAPHLFGLGEYVEPCAGAGDLIASLSLHGLVCHWSGDISDGVDALTLAFTKHPIITNPPWSRPILHAMIDHFTEIAPYAWLLFDADWAHTKQSAPYMQKCTDIVSVGRLIWIPGTTTSGKDNCAWYRFSKDKDGPTRFHGRAVASKLGYETFNSAEDDGDMGGMK